MNGVNSDPEPVAYLDAETMVVGAESPPMSGNFTAGIKMGGGFGNDIVLGANVSSVGGSPTLRISGGDSDAITRVDVLNVDGLEVKNNSNRLAVGGNNLALVSEIPDTSGFLTKTDADADYQPKGSYLTSVPVAGSAIGGVKNGGNVVVDGSGNMNVTIPDVSQFITETEADSKYQPKGSYLTSIPIGGTAIGGVKNGGNVTINADGTMNAEASGGVLRTHGETTVTQFYTIIASLGKHFINIIFKGTVTGGSDYNNVTISVGINTPAQPYDNGAFSIPAFGYIALDDKYCQVLECDLNNRLRIWYLDGTKEKGYTVPTDTTINYIAWLTQ